MGDHHIKRFIQSISGCIFNLKNITGFDTVMKALNAVVKKLKSHWKQPLTVVTQIHGTCQKKTLTVTQTNGTCQK
jgi:hypothetical protein